MGQSAAQLRLQSDLKQISQQPPEGTRYSISQRGICEELSISGKADYADYTDSCRLLS